MFLIFLLVFLAYSSSEPSVKTIQTPAHSKETSATKKGEQSRLTVQHLQVLLRTGHSLEKKYIYIEILGIFGSTAMKKAKLPCSTNSSQTTPTVSLWTVGTSPYNSSSFHASLCCLGSSL